MQYINNRMDAKKQLYIKIIIAQVAGYFVSIFLMQNVFLGPVPAVRAEFMRELAELPYTAVQYASTLPSAFKNYLSGMQKRKELSSKLPPPWVFEPNPGEVIPTTSGKYTGPTRAPKQTPNSPSQHNSHPKQQTYS
ncbi:MAG: hypothetical protein UZ22_OP11002000748 [Microgenomates bacterium OLB23]|nr:MAG: hypothetical protein UZ22_OP11002000748 [Microgenomates bacterium OLB23]